MPSFVKTYEIPTKVTSYVRGLSLSSDGKWLIAGQPFRDDNGTDSGAAMIFRNVNEDWIKVGDTLIGDGINDGFGLSADITDSGHAVAVGTLKGDYMKIYKLIEKKWMTSRKLKGDPGSRFGHSVSMARDGSNVIVGCPFDSHNGKHSGSVFFYQAINVSFVQRIYGDSDNAMFGASVSMSGDGSAAVVGSAYHDGIDGYGGDCVQAYRFDPTKNEYNNVGDKIQGVVNSNFGWSVSISRDGSRLAVGAYGDDTGGTNAGKTFIYDTDVNDNINLIGEIVGETKFDLSGWSVALSGDGKRVIVGAPYNGEGVYFGGQVNVYESSFF